MYELLLAAEEGAEEPFLFAWVIGAVTLGILLILLFALLAFGKGREHT